VLSLSGFSVDVIKHAEPYNQLVFANSTIDSEEGKAKLKDLWIQILRTFSTEHVLPFAKPFLTAVAVSLSFGLNNFVAYLAIVLADVPALLVTYISSDLLKDSRSANGRAFGKPVWDFQYPDASIFVTRSNLVGCAIATTQPGDEVFVSLGSTYPMILRPKDTGDSRMYVIRGFAYVDGVMDGECAGYDTMTFQIQ
jgi:hypothetical protein